MGRNKKKAYEPKSWETSVSSEHYTRFYDSCVKSDAFKDLSHASRTVFLILKMQYKGDYSGDVIKCPYKEFREYGMNTRTVKKSLDELESHGFIKVQHGVFVTKNLHRGENEYTFTDAWKKWRPEKNI